jgi:hypothetical protein
MVTPLDNRRWPQLKPVQATAKTDFQRSVERADKHLDGGVIIHSIQNGESALKVGGEHGFSLAELTLMNPKLAKNPGWIERGDTLVLVDKALFKEVTDAIETVEQASQNKGSRVAAETAGELRQKAELQLAPGFIEAGLPVAWDKAKLKAALDTHEQPVAGLGKRQPGFAEIASRAKLSAQSDLDTVFEPLRASIAAARHSGDWSQVQADAETQLAALSKGSPDPKAAIDGLADLLIQGGPKQGTKTDPGYETAIKNAQTQLLTEQPAKPILDLAAKHQKTVVGSDIAKPEYSSAIAPELTKAEEVTRDRPGHTVSPEWAAQILGNPKVQSALDTVIQDYPDGPAQRGAKTIDTLSALSDRAGRTEDGEAVVDRYASQLVAMAEKAGRNGATISPDFVQEFGSAFKDSIAAGRTPALAIRVAYHLEKNGHADAASTLLDQTGQGVKQQVKQAGETGKTFKSDVLYPNQVASAGSDDQQKLAGLQGVLEQQKPLVDKVDQAGASLVLTRAALENAPRDLLDGLPGGGTLDEAYDTLVKEADTDGSDVNLTVRLSPKAAVEWGRMVQQDQREQVKTLPDKELDQLLAKLDKLPAGDPAAEIAAKLGKGDAARRALRADPDLTVTLIQQFGTDAENGAEVPKQPTGMFIVRNSDDFIRSLQGTPATPLTSLFSAIGGVEFIRPKETLDVITGAPTLDPKTINNAWGYWFAGNAWKTWKVALGKPTPIMGPILDKSLMPLTLATTAEALVHGRPLDAVSWLPAIIGSLKSVGPKTGGALWLLTAIAVVGKSQYTRVEASNHYEPMLGAYLKSAYPDVDKPESLANCDEEGRPFLAMLPTLGKRLGFKENELPELVDWLYQQPVRKRDFFIDNALQVEPNDKGEYPMGTYDANARSGPNIQRYQIHSIEDVVLFAEQYDFKLPKPLSAAEPEKKPAEKSPAPSETRQPWQQFDWILPPPSATPSY